MGRGIDKARVKIGMAAETFYDAQGFQNGSQDKWRYAFCQSNTNNDHKFFPKKSFSSVFIKAWEYGGHPHDFYKSSRQARINDPYVHYETGKALERHIRLVAKVDDWRRRELLQEEMFVQMTKLQAVERQRHHFQELRRHMQLEQLHWLRPSTADPNQLSKCNSEPIYLQRPSSVNLSTQVNSLCCGSSKQQNRKTRSAPTSARCSMATKADLQDLDVFDGKHGF